MDYGILIVVVLALTGITIMFDSFSGDNDKDMPPGPEPRGEAQLIAGTEGVDLITQIFIWLDQEQRSGISGGDDAIRLHDQFLVHDQTGAEFDEDGQPLPYASDAVHIDDFTPGADKLVINPESGAASDAFTYIGYETVSAGDGTYTDIVLRYRTSIEPSGDGPQLNEMQSYIRVHNVGTLSDSDIVIRTGATAPGAAA